VRVNRLTGVRFEAVTHPSKSTHLTCEHDKARWQTPIVIVGPTAVGKTEVAIELANRIGGEIINADSMQIYSGMNIGTAKPDHCARERTVFHLLDIARPDEHYTVSDWKQAASLCIREVTARGRRAIVCGGAGLYVRALTDNWTMARTCAAPEIRDALRRDTERLGSPALHKRLSTVDPVTAERLHPNDSVRIVRALEVYEVTGIPISAHQSRDRQTRSPMSVHRIGLHLSRPRLYERIDLRVDQMMANGLESEVEGLMRKGYSRDLGPMRALGYKEVVALLSGEMDRAQAIETIKINTRRFSKRQQTWFRADREIQWIDVASMIPATIAIQVQDLVDSRLETCPPSV